MREIAFCCVSPVSRMAHAVAAAEAGFGTHPTPTAFLVGLKDPTGSTPTKDFFGGKLFTP